jgi:tetratricopeptide (TPR) repeat protein
MGFFSKLFGKQDKKETKTKKTEDLKNNCKNEQIFKTICDCGSEIIIKISPGASWKDCKNCNKRYEYHTTYDGEFYFNGVYMKSRNINETIEVTEAERYYNIGMELLKKYWAAISDNNEIENKDDIIEMAINNFTKAINTYPKLTDAYYYRGRSYKDKGLIDEAVIDFKKVITIYNDYRLKEDYELKESAITRLFEIQEENLKKINKPEPINFKLNNNISTIDAGIIKMIEYIKNAMETAPILTDVDIYCQSYTLRQNPFEGNLDDICEELEKHIKKDFKHWKFVEAEIYWDKKYYIVFDIKCFYKGHHPIGLFLIHQIARKGDNDYCLWYAERNLNIKP